ncbi:MAG TPA: metallophosphoesterase [Acidobacteriota bacterium]|nr:metallophosphoesterase [Acidobacteriota bacterium]HQG92279.1 metallophosphoesterase [Acidobacteriota bacterium]HQK89233.1 metallophosphoesterase [Acidobacteriota bacterium]
MDRRITIAHLSDLHLAVDDRTPRSEARLFGRLRGMNGHFERLLADPPLRASDLVVVTGDVTDHGDLAEWERFWTLVAAAGLRDRMAVLPGNHDVCCLGSRRHRPRIEDRARARAGLALGGHEWAFPWVRSIGGALTLFAVDAANAGNSTGLDNAVGRIGRRQLAELGRCLLLFQDAPLKLILIHHSPNIPRPATSRRRGERPLAFWERRSLQLDPFDRRCLRLLAAVFRVKAILHGHTHDSLDRTVGGVRIIGAPASTEPDAAGCLRYKLHTLHLDSGRLTSRTERVPAPPGRPARVH